MIEPSNPDGMPVRFMTQEGDLATGGDHMNYATSKNLGLRGESKRIYDLMVQAAPSSIAKHFDIGSGHAREHGVIIVDASGKNIGGCNFNTLRSLRQKGLLKSTGSADYFDLYELTAATSVAPKTSANPKRDAIAKQLNTLASQFDDDVPMDSFYEMMKELRRIAEKIKSELVDK